MIKITNCLLCGVTLYGLRDDAKFCSDEHRTEYHNLHRKLVRKLAAKAQLEQEIKAIRADLRFDIEKGRGAEVFCDVCGDEIIPGLNAPQKGHRVCDLCYDENPEMRNMWDAN